MTLGRVITILVMMGALQGAYGSQDDELLANAATAVNGNPEACAPAVITESHEVREHGAQVAPPHAEIHFLVSDFIDPVLQLPGRPELAASHASVLLGHSDPEARAKLTNILIPVSPLLPLNAATVAAGVEQGYFFYYPFFETDPNLRHLRYENPAFRGVISLDAMRARLRDSDFVSQLKNKSHGKAPNAGANAPKTVPMFQIKFNENFDEIVEAAGKAERLARNPGNKAFQLKDGAKILTNDTWVTPEVIALYKELFSKGQAFAVGVWRNVETDPAKKERLVLAGGAIGLCINGFYSSETLFTSHEPLPGITKEKLNDKDKIGGGVAGKLAVFAMFDYLDQLGVPWVDAQTVNDTTGRIGAQYIKREEYYPLLQQALIQKIGVPNRFPMGIYRPRWEHWNKDAIQQSIQAKLDSGQRLLLVPEKTNSGESVPSVTPVN